MKPLDLLGVYTSTMNVHEHSFPAYFAYQVYGFRYTFMSIYYNKLMLTSKSKNKAKDNRVQLYPLIVP